MKTIHKYDLPCCDEVTIGMPASAKVLCVKTQDERPKLWALVDDQEPIVERVFYIRGTGHRCDDLDNNCEYVGTFLMRNDGLVFHVFSQSLTISEKYWRLRP